MDKTSSEKPLKGKDFFSTRMLSKLTARVNNLKPDSTARWGIMRVDQMMRHLSLATGSALDYFELADESTILTRSVAKWFIVDFPTKMAKGLDTAKGFTTTAQRYDFDSEKNLLLEILQTASSSKTTAKWGPHVLFGHMNDNEWGRLLTMHFDHHLRQFGL